MIKRLFDGRLRVRNKKTKVNVFCTSDIEAIEGGKPWFEEIMFALRNSKVCISLMTPNSIYKPWILFESGGAYTLSTEDMTRMRMIPVYAYGLTKSNFPGPFTLIQPRNLGDKKEVLRLCREVASIFGSVGFRPASSSVNKLCAESVKGPSGWASVRQALVGERLDSSPFSVESVLANTNKHLFCAGQNLYYLASNPRPKHKIFAWLKEQTDRRIELLICDPRERDAIAAWHVVGQKYSEDLEFSVQEFQKWRRKARRQGLSQRLDIRVTRLVTASIVCADPQTSIGRLVLIPVVFGKPISGERPHFFVSRKDNKRVFDHYWETYRDVFSRGYPIDDVQIP